MKDNNKIRITGPSGFRFSIFESIEFVTEEVWDGINRGKDIFLSTDYLKALEMTPPKNMSFIYAILYDERRPVAVVYFQMLYLDSSIHEPLLKDELESPKRLSYKIHSKINKTISSKMLVCGNALLSGEHGFASVPGTDQEKLSMGISELIERIRRYEKINKKVNVIMIKDFYKKTELNNRVFQSEGYQDYFAGPNMVLSLREDWKTFNDYLSGMKSKYRGKVGSIIKKGGIMVKRDLSYDEIVANRNELYKLYLQVVGKAKFKLFVLNPDMLQELKLFLKEKFVLEAYYIDDRMVAYTTRIYNGEIMEGYSHGLDYSVNKEYEIYQNILLDDIRDGIKKGIRKINFGRTSIGMKSSFGAVPEEMEFLMQFKSIIPNQFLKVVSSLFKPSEEHCRNPFA